MPVEQLLAGGIATGALYALIAIGFSIIYRNTRTINFAQGDFLMVAGYVAMWSVRYAGLWGGYAIAIGAVALLSAGVEMIAFRPLYRQPSGAVLVIVSSIGLVFVLETAMLLIWGAQASPVPSAIGGTVTIGHAIVTRQQLLIVVCAAVLVLALELFLRSRIGVGMRAAAENADVADLLGVDGRRMSTLSYAIGGALTAVAGVLAAPQTLLTPTGGATIGLFGLVAAIVGGLGNVPGAVIGGLALGLINAFSSYVIGGTYTEALMFGVLVLTFLVRPGGLLREEGLVTRV